MKQFSVDYFKANEWKSCKSITGCHSDECASNDLCYREIGHFYLENGDVKSLERFRKRDIWQVSDSISLIFLIYYLSKYLN